MSIATDKDVLAAVLRLIESTLKIPANQVDIDADLESFGVNSLIVMELMENIEKEFDLNLTPAQFSNVDTVRSMAELVETTIAEDAVASGRVHDPTASLSAPSSVKQMPDARQQVAEAQSAKAPAADGMRNENGSDIHGYVARQYGIELARHDDVSMDEIVDILVYGHTNELLRHYGLPLADDDAAANDAALTSRSGSIAIVGMSCRLPDAPDPATFWNNLLDSRNSVREIPKSRWDWEAHYSSSIAQGKTVSKWGALVDDVDCFDANFFNIPADEAASMDPQLRLLMQESYRAVEDAGIDMRSLGGSRTGVFVGHEYAEYEHHLRRLDNQDMSKGPLFSSSSPSYYLSNRISHAFDLCGPSETYNVNCASSAVAINRAFHSLRSCESDLALVGAVSLNLFAEDYIAATQYGVLSPNGTSGVFDDDANGFTRGEGVATLVLKRLDDAERDNDRIYGLVRAVHQNFRGKTRNISEVKHESITRVLEECYEKGGLEPDAIDYIEVDGYASKWADSFEYEGVKGAFRKGTLGRKHVAMGSVKGNIGNVEPVSGVANVIKIALAMHHKRFPATISKRKISTFIDIGNAGHPLYIADREIPFSAIRRDGATPIRAGINSFADSGSNVHIVLEEYMSGPPREIDPTNARRLFVLSAKNAYRLEQYVQDYIQFLSGRKNEEQDFADLIYSAQVGREAHAERLAIVASTHTELLEKLVLVNQIGLGGNLGMDSREIFHGRIDPIVKNPLSSVITPEMVKTHLDHSAQSAQWKQVALMWQNGVDIPWAVLWRDSTARRITLPTYPFARQRHWMDMEMGDGGTPRVQATPTAATPVALAPAAEAMGVVQKEWYFHRTAGAPVGYDEGSPTSASGKISLFLRQEIGAQLELRVEDVDTDMDFIELGMNSIGLADLIIKIDRLLAIQLSPSILFKYSQVASLSEYLAKNHDDVLDTIVVTRKIPMTIDAEHELSADLPTTPSTPTDVLIPLQVKGDKPPIFAVPGAGATALSLHQLSHALGAKQPFYCLEPAGLDGRDAPATSIEEVAAFNIEAMKCVQPAGPYHLIGYSNGGVAAFEMARSLLECGEQVSSLTLLDSLAPAVLANAPIEDMTVQVFSHFVSSLGATAEIDVEQLTALPAEARSGFLYDHVAALGIDLPKPKFLATFEAATRSERLCREYRPGKLPRHIEVTLVRATSGFRNVPSDYGWSEFVEGTLRICDIDADHFTLLEKEAVQRVARKLDQNTIERIKHEKRGSRASRKRALVAG